AFVLEPVLDPAAGASVGTFVCAGASVLESVLASVLESVLESVAEPVLGPSLEPEADAVGGCVQTGAFVLETVADPEDERDCECTGESVRVISTDDDPALESDENVLDDAELGV
ncbi:hypothetical protein PF011_g16678, partial [Phytophthora fragariae]